MKLVKFTTTLLLSFMLSISFAHGDKGHKNIGTEAQKYVDQNKVYHKEGLSMTRKMHPNWMVHKRDMTLRQGVRTDKHSFKGCVNCHATKKDANSYHPINAEEQFCSECHKETGVSMDCFSCHRSTPGKSAYK